MSKKATTRKRERGVKQWFPRGWDENRVKRLIAYYDNQSEDEGVAEYEAAMKLEGQSMMLVPSELVPEIHRLILSRRGA